MVHEIVCSQSVGLDFDIFVLRPSRTIGCVVFVISLLALAAYALYASRRAVAQRVERWASLLIPSGLFLGLFTATFAIIDEVSVNLEHAYNLKHFGLFSMSSRDRVDGTVELLFYLIHTPFARDRATLILGNYLICLLVGWLHIFVLWISRLFSASRSPLLSLSCFSICATVVTMLSTGFGNGLASLLYLVGIVCLASRRDRLALVVCGLLPIVRPDAMLLSCANIVVVGCLLARDWIVDRKRPSLRSYLPLVFLPFVSLVVYMAVYRQVFHVWPPTPILFKRVDGSALSLFSAARFGSLLLRWASQGDHAAAVTVACPLLWKLAMQRGLRKIHTVGFVLLCHTVVLTPVFLLYNFGLALLLTFSFHTVLRYWLAFEIVLALLLIETVGRYPATARSEKLLRARPFFLPYYCSCSWLRSLPYRRSHGDGLIDRTTGCCSTESILPPDFTVSTSEMSTFGLMIDRPVIDLWGYSTREIADFEDIQQKQIAD